MKKYVLSLVYMLMCYFVYGQDAGNILHEFKNEQDVECIEVSGSSLIVAKQSIDEKDENYGFFQKIKSISVLNVKDSNPDVKKRFLKHVELLPQSGYERLVRAKGSNGKQVDILAKQKGKYIKEFLVLCSNGNNEVFVLFEGKFFREDLEKLIDMESNK